MPSSVGRQMPCLYLRGSLCNQTMKNLNDNQQIEISKIVEELVDDPTLQAARIEFRNALRYTIKGDYNDIDAADQEYKVALWRAAVAAKFGWGSHEPCEKTLTEPVQRKKFFQTWVFNYLRQILLENKRSYINSFEETLKPVWEAAQYEISTLFGKKAKTSVSNKKEHTINIDLFALPHRQIESIHKIKNKYMPKGVVFKINDNSIQMVNNRSKGHESIKMKVPTMVNIVSTNPSEDDEDQDIEIEAVDYSEFQDPDSITTFTDSLSEEAQKVMKIIISPPNSYIEKYGEKPVKRYIAEYYGFSNRQIKDIWSELKLKYTTIVGTPNF
jgi:hypothetical protein